MQGRQHGFGVPGSEHFLTVIDVLEHHRTRFTKVSPHRPPHAACPHRWAAASDPEGRRVLDLGEVAPVLGSERDPNGLPRQRNFAITSAVSLMRVEKPHSLSYQERTRTSLPSTICVCAVAKVEEWLSWLKSEETSFSSV